MSEDIPTNLFARIVNRQQRDALVRAIEGLEEIPDYAWTPIPDDVTDEQWDEFRAFVRPAAEQYVAGETEPLW